MTCEFCDGTGSWGDVTREIVDPCPHCNGTGRWPPVLVEAAAYAVANHEPNDAASSPALHLRRYPSCIRRDSRAERVQLRQA